MALCLPRKRRAASLATRPSTLSVASITNHSCFTSAGLALKVFMGSFQIAHGTRLHAGLQDLLIRLVDAAKTPRGPLGAACSHNEQVVEAASRAGLSNGPGSSSAGERTMSAAGEANEYSLQLRTIAKARRYNAQGLGEPEGVRNLKN